MKKAVRDSGAILLLIGVLLAASLSAQEQRSRRSVEDDAYGARFFDQLRAIFGRFRDSDLQRAFQEAQPIQCSELVGRKGEWRQVAFFNEDRTLGDWCRESLEEVKVDLAVFTFKGICSGNRSEISVATEFPTDAGIKALNDRTIAPDQIDITVNDPVNAVLDPRTMAMTFDLPYLFLKEKAPRKLYSLMAPAGDSAYATNVASRWECKTVSSKDVTYRYLICRVGLVPLGKLPRGEKWEPSFGSSAFFILSDGTEAKTHVNLTFGDEKPAEEKPADTTPAPASPPRPVLKRK
jgi:hypothetical protein